MACKAHPHELAQWSGTKLVEAPPRAVSAGDHLVFRAGMLHITFDVLDMQAPRQLTLDIALPFGVTNREHIQITPINSTVSRDIQLTLRLPARLAGVGSWRWSLAGGSSPGPPTR